MTLARLLGALALVVGMLPLALDGGLEGRVASAEEIQPFTVAYSANTNGAIDIIGNALLTCGTSAACQETLAGTRNSGNGSFTMVGLDADDDVLPAALSDQTGTSSRAVYSPPAGSRVLYAGLYWSSESTNATRNRLSLLTPGATQYQTITGDVAAAGALYQTAADVTDLVAAAGPGDYWAGNITGTAGQGRYAAWSMVVVYENDNLPARNLNVYEGFGRVTSSFTRLDVPISGFLTPPQGDVRAEIGVVAYEGDQNITGDQILIDTDPGAGQTFQNLSNAANPVTNFGNGSISDAGVNDLSGTPGWVNTLSLDADEFSTTNLLANGQRETTVRFQTTGDFWYPGVLTTAIDLFVPEFPEVTKTVVDVNGGEVLPGDELEYRMMFRNDGNDGAQNVVFRDLVPTDTTFVPGSIQTVNAVVSSSSSPSEVIVNVGTGATSTQGGSLATGEEFWIAFRVRVAASAAGTDVENIARLIYTAQTLQQRFTFTTNEVVSTVPPLARLSVTKTGSPDPVVPGENVTWTIVVRNDGPNPATGITLDDSMSNNSFVSVSGADCPDAVAGATTISCTIPDLASGATRTVTVVASTPPSLADGALVSDTVTVDANEYDDDTTNDSATARVTARPVADLSITKTDDVDPVRPGDTIGYTITVTNPGPSDARNVRVVDSPDAQTTPTAITSPDTTDCSLVSRSCTIPVLAAGDTATVRFEATARTTASGTTTNTARVRTDAIDPNADNDVTSETTTVTPLADIGVTKTTVDAPLVAGETVRYTVRVTNAGPSTAADVTVTDALPAGLTLVSAAPTQGSCSGTSTITCSLGSVAAGAAVDVTVTALVGADRSGQTIVNTASATTSTDEPAGGGDANSGSTSDTVENVADLRIVKELLQGNPVIAGTDFDFTITVTNDGPSATDGPYTITDLVPEPLVVDAISGPGCPTTVTNDVVCTSSTPIAPGDSVVVTISGSVPPGADAAIDNVATVDYATDPDTTDNSSTSEVDLEQEADVRIDKEWTAAPAVVVAGTTTDFTLVVENRGPSTSENVVVTDQLPSGMTLVNTTAPVGATCAASTATAVSCDLGDLAAGTTVTVTVTVLVADDAPGGRVDNRASVSSDTVDRNVGNNADVDSIDVVRSADLRVSKVADDVAPAAGETITYTVVVGNAGPSTGEASFVGDELPAGLTIVGAPEATRDGAPIGSCTNDAGVVTCDFGQLGVAADPNDPADPDVVTVTYRAVLDPDLDPGTTLTNNAVATSPDDADGGTASESIVTETEADLVVVKTASNDPATPGGTLVYTITVENLGPSDARGVVLPDPLPAGFTLAEVDTTQGSCTAAVECDLGTLPASSQAIITISGTIDPDVSGPVTNTTDAVRADTLLVEQGDDVGSVTVQTAPSADLTITKSASPTTIAAGGGNVTYTISVANSGPSDALDVVVDDVLPDEFVVQSVTPDATGVCADADAFPCTFDLVANGDAADITVVGTFPSTATAGTTTNTATVTSPTDPDAQPGSPKSDTATVEVTESADLSITKSGPVTIEAGSTRTSNGGDPETFSGGARYRLNVRNDGPSVASDVTVVDQLDTAILDVADVVVAVAPSGAGTCTVDGDGLLSCSLGDVAVGTLVTVTLIVDVRSDATPGDGVLSNTATVSSVDADPVAANDSSTTTSDVTAAADVSISKTGPAQFVAGQDELYTITVTNAGPSDASNVVVGDPTPAGVSFGAFAGTAGCTAFPCTIPTLTAGESVTILVPATVAPDSTITSVSNTATITASDQVDPTTGNDSSTATSTVIRRADVELVSKTSTPTTVDAGETITYTVVARNAGPSTADAMTVTDTVPAGSTLVASSLPAECSTTGTAPGETITCEFGNLAPDTSVTVVFDVVADDDLEAGDAIVNTASADSETVDPDADNDSATVTTPVTATAAVSITKSDGGRRAVPGEAFSYELTVTNAGPSVARDVVVTDDVSAIFADGSVSVTPSGAPAGLACDGSVSCTLASLAPGSFAITITGTVRPELTTGLSNTASVSTDGGSNANDPDTADNTAVETSPTDPSADLRIVKSANPVPIDPGAPVVYTITVFNDGPSDAADVVVGDTLPADITPAATDPLAVTRDPAGGATCDAAALTCSFASVPTGDSVEFTLTADASPRATGTAPNTASIVSSGTPDPSAVNDSTTIDTPVKPEADVQITKTTVTPTVVAGELVRYRITIFNDGPARARQVSVTDVLPANATFVNASNAFGTCSGVADGEAGGTLTCSVGDLGDQATATITVELLVDPDATGTLVNTVTGGSAVTEDPDETNNRAPNAGGVTADPIVTRADLRIRKELTEDSLVAGDSFEYVLTVVNDGPSDAMRTITITDPLPPAVSDADPAESPERAVVVDDPNCSYDDVSNTVTCTFDADLPVGGRIPVTISGFIREDAAINFGGVAQNTATVSSEDDPNPANDTGTADAELVANADLVVSKSFADDSVIAGNTTLFTIAAVNNGPSTAVNAELRDVLPAGFTVESLAGVTAGTCTNTATTVTCSADLLDPGQTLSVDVIARVDPTRAGGPVTNRAEADSDTPDRNVSNNSDVDDIRVTRLAQLEVEKTSSVSTVTAGTAVTYTVTVTNLGPSSAEATELGDSLPEGVEVDASSLPPECSVAANLISCVFGEILPTAPDDVRTITYRVVVDPAEPNGTEIVNTARVDSATPLQGDPTDASVVTVDVSSDVSITKSVEPTTAVAGTDVTYRIAVTNAGPSISRNTRVVDVLPDGLTLVGATADNGTTCDAGADVSCLLGTLVVGETVTVTVVATVDASQPDGSTITNTAELIAPDDRNAGNDTASTDLAVTTVADLTVAKSGPTDPAVPGGSITYTVTVSNAGPSDAQEVVVGDTAPDGVTFTSVTGDGAVCDLTAVCRFDTLAPGSVEITLVGTVDPAAVDPIVNVATVSGATNEGADDDAANSSEVRTDLAPVADVGLAKRITSGVPVPGRRVTFEIDVTNAGPSVATDVVVTDVFDAVFSDVTTPTPGCSVSGNTLTCSLDAVDPGTRIILVDALLDEAATGTVSNSATITSTGTAQGDDTLADTATVSATTGPEADLAITKRATPDPVVAGEQLTYVLSVDNLGPSSATGVVVADDSLPAGFTLDSVESSQGACTSLPCAVGTLDAGSGATVTVVGSVDSDRLALDTNTATVTSDTFDGDGANNSSTSTVEVVASADLNTTKSLVVPADGTAVPGAPVRWEIVVVNDGSSDATGVVIRDTIPAEVTDVVVSSTGVTPPCDAVPCTVGRLAPGTSVTLTIDAELPADVNDGVLVNSVATESDTFDPDTTDDAATAENPIARTADVSIVKTRTSPTGPVTPGLDVEYTLTVSNAGPSDARAIDVTDVLPDSFDPATVRVSSTDATCAADGLTVTCTRATLTPTADPIEIVVTATLRSDLVDGGVDNTAVVSTDDGTNAADPDVSDNESTERSASTAASSLEITKELVSGPPVPGTALTYDITVTNTGPSTAREVVVTDSLPAAVTNVTTTTPGCVVDGRDLTCDLGSLPVGSTTVTVSGDLDEAFVGVVENTAAVTSPTDPDAPVEASSSETARPDADLSLVKTANPDPVEAGASLTYTLLVTNAGPSTAVDVSVGDSLPVGFDTDSISYVTATSPTPADCTLPCPVGALASGDTATVTIVGTVSAAFDDLDPNLASVSSATPDSDPTDNGDQADPVVDERAELSISKRATPTVLVPGDTVRYTIDVSNAGPSDARDVVVSDDLPSALTPVSVSSTIGDCSAGFPCSLGTVAAGAVETVTVTMFVPSDLADASVSNTANVASATADTDPADDSATTTNAVVGEASLSVVKRAPSGDLVPGRPVTYTIEVSNAGPSDARDVSIGDVLDPAFDPASISFTTATTGADAPICSLAGSTVSCTDAVLEDGETSTVTVTATVLASFTGASIANTATVESPTDPDAQPGSPVAATVTRSVTPSADLSISKVDDVAAGSSVDPGGTVSYTITVINDGPSDARSVTVDDVLPAGLVAPITITSSQGACDSFPCDLGTVTPSSPATVTVTATVSDRAVGSLGNTATVSSPTPDPTTNDLSASETTAVTPFADLRVTKSLAPSPAVAGTPARYTVVVTNAGPATAAAVELVDTLPAGVTVTGVATVAGTCDAVAGTTLTCDLGDLADQDTVTVTIDVLVDADRTEALSNTATASSAVADPNPAAATGSTVDSVVVTADLRIDKAIVDPDADAPILAGDDVRYSLTVVNDGPSTAVETIVVTDVVPDEIDISTVGVTPALVDGSGCSLDLATRTITCTFPADLPADGSALSIEIAGRILSDVLVGFDNTATVTTIDDPGVTQNDPDPTDDSSTATATTAADADLVTTKTFADDSTLAGDPSGTVFTIVVVNEGPSDAVDVTVTDDLPAGMTVRTVTPTVAEVTPGTDAVVTCDPAGLPCTVDRLEPGDVLTLTVVADVDPDTPQGRLTNSASATSATTPDRNPSNNTGTDSIDVERAATITVDKTAAPSGSQDAGERIDYAVVVVNEGPSSAEASILGDQLPAGAVVDVSTIRVDGVAATPATTPSCSAPGGILTCDLGVLAPTTTTTVTYSVTVDAAVARGETVRNAAQISSPTNPNDGDAPRTSAVDVAVTTSADLMLQSKVATPDTVVAGETVSYLLTGRNRGPSVSRSVVVTDVVPAGLSVVTGTLDSRCSVAAGPGAASTITCDLGDVAPVADGVPGNVSIAYDVVVAPDVPAGTTPINSASIASDPAVDAPTADPDATNDGVDETITVAAVADLGLEKSADPATATPGRRLTYTLTLTNAGPSWARDVTVTDAAVASGVFAGPIDVSSSGAAVATSCDDTAVSCTFAEVPVGVTTITISGIVDPDRTADLANTVEITANATDQSDADHPNVLADTASVTTPVTPIADVGVAKTIVGDVVPGQDVDFTITVRNDGPSTASGVVVTDELDPALTDIRIGAGATVPSGCSVIDQTLICTFATLDVGTFTLPVTALLDESFRGTLRNTVTVTADSGQGIDVAPDSSTATSSSEPRADIALTKTASGPVTAGEDVVYTLVVDNVAGPSTATGVVVSDTLPDGLTLLGVTSTQGACAALPCVVGTLEPGRSETVTVTARLDSDLLALDPNVGLATVGNGIVDPDTANNRSSAAPTVVTRALVTTTKDLVDGPPVPGEPVEWTVTVRNDGPSDALDVRIDDTLPAQVENAVFTSDGATCDADGCDLGTIAAGETVSVTVTADLPADTDPGDLVNSVTASSAAATPTPFDPASVPTATATDPVVPSADLRASKSVEPTVLVPGETATYTLTVVNDGPSDARDVVVADLLPAELDLASPIVVEDVGATPATTCTRTGRDVECTQDVLSAGSTITIEITGRIDDAVTDAVVNRVSVTSATADPDFGNDTTSISTPVRGQADIGIEKRITTDPVVPGRTIDFEIVVTNDGPSVASGVSVVDVLGAEYLDVTTATPGCTVDVAADGTTTVSCDLDVVGVGAAEARTISVSAVLDPSTTGAVSNSADLTTDTDQVGVRPDSATATADVVPSADLSMVKTATPADVVAGEDVTYVLTVSNDGPSDSHDVVVTDELPAGLTLVSVTSSQGGCLALPCELGTVAASSSATVTVVATLDPSALSLAPNEASVASSTADPDPANDRDTAAPTVVTRADLSVTKVATTPTAVPGESIRWIITVSNAGPSDARDVVVVDEIPIEVDQVVVGSSQGGCTSFDCAVGTLPAGSSATITIDAEVPSDVLGDTIENTATVVSGTLDPEIADDADRASTPIAPAADLSLVKTGPSGTVLAGTDVEWTVTVTNSGPSDATDVVVTDVLPDALDPASVAVEVTQGSAVCAVDGLAVTCTRSSLADGDSITLVVSGTVRADFTGASIDNTATVSSATVDPDPGDDSDSASSDSRPLAGLEVSTSLDADRVSAGDTVGVVVTVTNRGPSTAADTVVRIPLPASLTVRGAPVLVGAPAGATVRIEDGVLVVDVGDLAPDAPFTIEFDVAVSPDTVAGTIGVTARATTTTDQDVVTDDVSSDSVQVEVDVDLSITKVAAESGIAAGDTVGFTITVTNDGPSTATGVTVSDELPDGLVAVSATSSAGTCDVTGDSVRCDDLVVPADGGTVVVDLTAEATGNGSVTNVATVTCDCIDGRVLSSTGAAVDIERTADLSVSKRVSPDRIRAGQTATFTVVVRNGGPDDALDVVVRDDVPLGLSVVSTSTSVGDYDPATGRWTIGELADGAEAVLTVVVTAPDDGSYQNVATVSTAVTDPTTTNDSASAVLGVTRVELPRTGGSGGLRLIAWAIGLLVLGGGLWLLGTASRSSRSGRGGPGTLDAT